MKPRLFTLVLVVNLVALISRVYLNAAGHLPPSIKSMNMISSLSLKRILGLFPSLTDSIIPLLTAKSQIGEWLLLLFSCLILGALVLNKKRFKNPFYPLLLLSALALIIASDKLFSYRFVLGIGIIVMLYPSLVFLYNTKGRWVFVLPAFIIGTSGLMIIDDSPFPVILILGLPLVLTLWCYFTKRGRKATAMNMVILLTLIIPFGILGYIKNGLNQKNILAGAAHRVYKNPLDCEGYFKEASEYLKRSRITHADDILLLAEGIDGCRNFPDLFKLKGDIFLKRTALKLAIRSYKKAPGVDRCQSGLCNALGNAYLTIKKSDAAIKEFKRSLSFNPENARALYSLGKSLVLEGRYNEAREILKSLLPTQTALFQMGLAWILANVGNTVEARGIFEDVLKDDPEIKLEYAAFLQHIGDTEKALEVLDDWRKKGGLSMEYTWMMLDNYRKGGNHKKALQTLRELSELDPDNPLIYLRMAEIECVRSDGPEHDPRCKAWIEKALSLGPEYLDNPYHRIIVALLTDSEPPTHIIKNQGELEYITASEWRRILNACLTAGYLQPAMEAFEYLMEEEDLFLTSPSLVERLADMALKGGHFQDALRMAERFLQTHPDSFFPYMVMARIEERKAYPMKAIDYYEKSLDLSGFHLETLTRLINLYIETGDKDKALKHLETLRELTPESIFLDIARARILHIEGRGDEAQTMVQALKEQRGEEEPFIHLFLTQIHIEREEYEAALLQAQEGLKIFPDNVMLLTIVGFLKAKSSELDGARQVLHKALKIDPYHPDIHFHLGWIDFQEGLSSGAEGHIATCLKLKPGHLWALKLNLLLSIKRDDLKTVKATLNEIERIAGSRDEEYYRIYTQYMKMKGLD